MVPLYQAGCTKLCPTATNFGQSSKYANDLDGDEQNTVSKKVTSEESEIGIKESPTAATETTSSDTSGTTTVEDVYKKDEKGGLIAFRNLIAKYRYQGPGSR